MRLPYVYVRMGSGNLQERIGPWWRVTLPSSITGLRKAEGPLQWQCVSERNKIIIKWFSCILFCPKTRTFKYYFYVQICMHSRTRTRTCPCNHIYTHTPSSTPIRTCVCARVCIYFLHIWAYGCAWMSVCMYMYIYACRYSRFRRKRGLAESSNHSGVISKLKCIGKHLSPIYSSSRTWWEI